MNPRYAAWRRATGGGPNWEFMAWISAKATAYRAARGLGRHVAIVDHDDFTRWIESQVGGRS